jgi:hypothetical protein
MTTTHDERMQELYVEEREAAAAETAAAAALRAQLVPGLVARKALLHSLHRRRRRRVAHIKCNATYCRSCPIRRRTHSLRTPTMTIEQPTWHIAFYFTLSGNMSEFVRISPPLRLTTRETNKVVQQRALARAYRKPHLSTIDTIKIEITHEKKKKKKK